MSKIFFIIGKTGVGKTNTILSLINQNENNLYLSAKRDEFLNKINQDSYKFIQIELDNVENEFDQLLKTINDKNYDAIIVDDCQFHINLEKEKIIELFNLIKEHNKKLFFSSQISLKEFEKYADVFILIPSFKNKTL